MKFKCMQCGGAPCILENNQMEKDPSLFAVTQPDDCPYGSCIPALWEEIKEEPAGYPNGIMVGQGEATEYIIVTEEIPVDKNSGKPYLKLDKQGFANKWNTEEKGSVNIGTHKPKEFPPYAKMGEVAVRLSGETSGGLAKYYRHAGQWELKAHWVDSVLHVIADAHFHDMILVPATKEEWADSNAGYIGKVHGRAQSESPSMQSLCRKCCGTGLKNTTLGTELCVCQSKDEPENAIPF